MQQRYLVALCISVCLFVPLSTAWAQVEVEPDQRYLLLATERTGTMEDELAEAAALGFRIVTGSPTSGAEMALLLERVATPPDTYEYQLLATTRTSTMQEELAEAAAQGFRLLPRTMIAKRGRWTGGQEIVVVLERSPGGGDHRYEYLLLATTLTGSLQDELSQALDGGYTLAGLVSREEHMVILEREVP